MELTEFISARLGEAEALAKATAWDDSAATWTASASYNGEWWCLNDDGGENVATVKSSAADNEGVARYIASHDPARALREVAAKRAILAAYERAPLSADLEESVIELAAVWSDHPDYRAEWAR